MWEILHALMVGLAAGAGFAVGWLLGRRFPPPAPVRPPSVRPIGYELSDLRKLDEILGTDAEDPQSWGSAGIGPLSEAQLRAIADRFHRGEFKREDLAALLLEVRRMRLKDGP